jgi:cytochrome c oxidase subunit 2
MTSGGEAAPCIGKNPVRIARLFLLSGIAVMIAGCTGPQSALDPAGEEARQVTHLFWVMAIGGLAIWAGVVALLVYALQRRRQRLGAETAGRLIFWAGAVFPAVVLTALLSYAFWLMPGLRPFAEAGDNGIRIEIVGRQYWWDVLYRLPDGTNLRTANEIAVPAGERVEFSLTSPDVIHSFWIPALAGKMDLIPGRVNRLSVLAEKPGTYRGACAEYCGTSHAYMAV